MERRILFDFHAFRFARRPRHRSHTAMSALPRTVVHGHLKRLRRSASVQPARHCQDWQRTVATLRTRHWLRFAHSRPRMSPPPEMDITRRLRDELPGSILSNPTG